MSVDVNKAEAAFARFVSIIKELRHPVTGCPWDLEQDHRSLRPYLIEESYEVLEAIESNDDTELASELGDVLLQVVLHSQVAEERGAFSIEDVINEVSEKMIRRHPHVFADVKVGSADEVVSNWEQIKIKERESGCETRPQSLLAGIPNALPALIRAQRLGEKAAKVSFDWENVEGVWAKVAEELHELSQEVFSQKAIESERKTALMHEMGDVLFSLCQLSRWLGISAEDALRECCARFTDRFRRMEQSATRPFSDHSANELEELWQQAKK